MLFSFSVSQRCKADASTILHAPGGDNQGMQPLFDGFMRHEHNRRAVLGLLAVSGAGWAVPGRGSAQAQPWKNAPFPGPQRALDLQGQAWTLPQPGKALALNFWASWCEPCRSEMPALQTMADLYADKLTVVALNYKERAATVTRFARSTGLTLPVLLDPAGGIAAALGVKVFPTTVLYGSDGKPRWRVQGALDWTSAEAGRLVEGLWS